MDPRFKAIFNKPENEIFQVVFFPDRIYHAAYLNATRSNRYRYNVTEVRGKHDIQVLKGEVYLDGQFLTNFLRVEYRSGRIVEQSREKGRLAQDRLRAWIQLLPNGAEPVSAEITLHLCRWTDSYQAEIWGTLEAPSGLFHDFQVLDQMGRDAPITRVRQFSPHLREIKGLRRLAVAFRENPRDVVSGFEIKDPEWDNNFRSSHQEPRTQDPSAGQNTVSDQNYLIDFQRGWYLDATATQPVRYRNAMMDGDNPDRGDQNIIEMRWLLQRELGSSVIFFHEVTIPPKTVEGTHQHIGSEELYYITEGEGFAYMAEGDDPATEPFPTVERHVFGLSPQRCKKLPVRAGNVIYTKSGGVHGIENPGDRPLKFVAFLYHSS